MTERLKGVRALLIDLEGTVYQGSRLIPGAAEALAALRERGIPHVFVTNTTSRPRSALIRELGEMGLVVDPDRLYTAPRAALAHLERRGMRRVHLMLRPALREEFPRIELDDAAPEAVVLGDLGDEMTFARLNHAFRLLLGGAELVTLARNRYWRAEDGLTMDVGAFAAALEYASGKPAVLVGKPAPEFFRTALEGIGVAAASGATTFAASETAVVGDDLESDIGGAQAVGMRGILVRTGKHRPEELARSEIRPDAVLDSLADLPDLL